jgi:hypothetical protein
MVIGKFATFDNSNVMCPSNPASMNPAVEWMSKPRRPSELLPSTRATRSLAMATRSVHRSASLSLANNSQHEASDWNSAHLPTAKY